MVEKRKSGTGGERMEDAEGAVPTKSPAPCSTDVPGEGWVYFILAEELGRVKIGRGNDANKRLKQLQTGSPTTLRLLSAFLTDDPCALESKLHAKHFQHRVHGEWFTLTDELRSDIERAALFSEISTDNVRVAVNMKPLEGLRIVRKPGETTDEFMSRVYADCRKMGLMSD